MSRFIVQPQKWSEEYPYDKGYATLDTVERRQVGWCLHKCRADERAAEQEAQRPAAPAHVAGEGSASEAEVQRPTAPPLAFPLPSTLYTQPTLFNA